MTLPDWMQNPAATAPIRKERVRKTRFITRTMQQIQQILAEDLKTEKYAGQSGLLQRIDPRTKLISAIILILAAGLTRSLAALIALSLLSAVLLRLSSLPVWTLEKRIWGIIPLITLIAALPGIFSIFNPGTPLLMVNSDPEGFRILGLHMAGPIYISRQGVRAALFLFFRVGVSVSIGTLLVLTTPVADLLRSLTSLRIPGLFVMTIEMSYRYIILLLTSSLEMFEARKMRTAGNLPGRVQRELIGSSIAALFARSMALSEEVYQSMTARCYTGEAVSSRPLALRNLDIICLTIIIMLAVVIVIGGTLFE